MTDDYDARKDGAGSYEAAIKAMRMQKIRDGEIVPWERREVIGDCVLYQGDCMEVMQVLDKVDTAVTDPPYEEQAHKSMRRTRAKIEGRVDSSDLTFGSITEDQRDYLTKWCSENCFGWAGIFCQVEAVGKYKNAFENGGAKWDRAWAWVKPDAAPRFNGQGPAQGFECFATAWCGAGTRGWNGGGRRNVLTCNVTANRASSHPTEKPVLLINQLIELYTNVEKTILDPFMGSGTTGVACVKTGRKFIGIEQDPDYFQICVDRIREAYAQRDLFVAQPERIEPHQTGFDLSAPATSQSQDEAPVGKPTPPATPGAPAKAVLPHGKANAVSEVSK